MQKSPKWRNPLLILVLVTLVQVPVWAQGAESAQKRVLVPGGGAVNRLIRQVRHLDLSDEQIHALRQLMRKARERGQEIQESVKAARRKLARKSLRGDDQEALSAAVDDLSEVLLKQAVFQARVSNAVRGQLTQKQKTQLKQRAQQRSQRDAKQGRDKASRDKKPRGERQRNKARQEDALDL